MRRVWGLLVGLLLAVTGCHRSPVVEDAEALIAAIERNYPYLELYENHVGVPWSIPAREKVRAWEAGRYADQVDLFDDLLRGLNGHVGLVHVNEFRSFHDGYLAAAATYPQLDAWKEVLSRPAVEAAYRYEPGETPPAAESRPAVASLTRAEARQAYLYLRVPSFLPDLIVHDKAMLLDFLRVSSKPGLPIVIDLRGNGGGSDNYWKDLLVAPLLEHELSVTATILYRGGAESLPFLKSVGLEVQKTTEHTTSFPLFSTDEMTIHAAPEHFPHGKIVVIMDHHNFSSSETFVSFVKASGWATLVGQASAGDGIGFDPIFIELPRSHLLIRLPISAALNPDGTFNAASGTQPDVAVSPENDALRAAEEIL